VLVSVRCSWSRAAQLMALICLSVSLGAAQSNGPDNKASLTGRVINESGSILRDAQVVLASSTGARLAIPLNNKGVYSVSGLIPGTYKLTVSASNLADAVFDNIALAPDQHLVLDRRLDQSPPRLFKTLLREKRVRSQGR